MQQLQGQHILILGLGISGMAMARWCARYGAQVVVADTREEPPHLQALQNELPAVQFVGGAFTAQLIEGTPIGSVFVSPGLKPDATAPVIDAAKAKGLSVGGELSLFAQALKDLQTLRAYTPQVLAITGTNGKTTVTSLTGKLVERAGKKVQVAGNIGPSLLDTLSAALDSLLPEVWVLELSSFQLVLGGSFEPTAATVLNISQDHLDWHGSMAAYALAKACVFGPSTLMVLNREDATVMAMLPQPVRVKLQKPIVRNHVTFGAGMPLRPGDFGIEVLNGMTWLVRAIAGDETRKRRKDEGEEIHIQRLIPADALRIRGRHNAVNALSGLALASSAGCSLAPMLYGLREYRGEPHRVESLGILHGVEYFDDSKGTNVGATVAALQGLGVDRRVVVILGGDGKGQDFSPLEEPVSRYSRAVILMGQAGTAIRHQLAATGAILVDAQDMQDAVSKASKLAQSGDAVLLSPACASFDMFENYVHRAEVYCKVVTALADASGVLMEAQV
ncbi:UDP-N-acetylmuramoyl-L-alanine--D-glutamate ligase [Limnohabitans sp. Rim8]|uniref:UDP-N-acetylmuramoyl-L-alanine--D-glutamate ligase n=1 Tax=Limnohabitans sp. Rim8 TaxID=1100718 RepID=UPI00260472AB|nr:UDP-N-acetylmuramoyl-L-alanine--D-glutamate ligase [Limnohabitans sp. Rim8]